MIFTKGHCCSAVVHSLPLRPQWLLWVQQDSNKILSESKSVLCRRRLYVWSVLASPLLVIMAWQFGTGVIYNLTLNATCMPNIQSHRLHYWTLNPDACCLWKTQRLVGSFFFCKMKITWIQSKFVRICGYVSLFYFCSDQFKSLRGSVVSLWSKPKPKPKPSSKITCAQDSLRLDGKKTT